MKIKPDKQLLKLIKSFQEAKPDWSLLPGDWPETSLTGLTWEQVGRVMELKVEWDLAGRPRPPVNSRYSSRNFPYSPVTSRGSMGRDSLPRQPFRLPALGKSKRQARSTQGYKAAAYWQNGMLLRDLLTLWFEWFKEDQRNGTGKMGAKLLDRLEGQILDALRSFLANIEEGWSRPTTKEYLDYLGFAQASLIEVGGDLERLVADGYLKWGGDPSTALRAGGERREDTGGRAGEYGRGRGAMRELGVPTPSRDNPYPPRKCRESKGRYGKRREERLREFTGRTIHPREMTGGVLLELVSKTSHLVDRAVSGLQRKLVGDEEAKLKLRLDNLNRDTI